MLKRLNLKLAVATSGVAGPNDEGDIKKGTVYITVKVNEEYYDCKIVSPRGQRNEAREHAVKTAYEFLKEVLLNNYIY